MADTKNTVKEITEKLEQGVKDVFSSDKYAEYLKTMSRFHRYSTRNTMLIYLQKPDATRVAGFRKWETDFGRHVKKGERGIRIFAPTPFTIKAERQKIDPDTQMPVIGDDGLPETEEYEKRFARFKVISVFDVSQTDGKPLPSLVENLTGDVERYELFMDALRAVSPLPIVFEQLAPDNDGVCRMGDCIAIREGMSEIQTVCAVIHEITHAVLHDMETQRLLDENAKPKDRGTEEVEAESVSYAVCQYYGIETSANSLAYIAEWSKTRELKELNASLDTIRKTAAELIDAVDGKFKELAKERGIDLAIGVEQTASQEPIAAQSADASTDRPTVGKVYARYNDQITVIVGRDEAYINAFENSDEQNARIKSDQAVRSAVLGLYAESDRHIELYRQYTENPEFKVKLEEYVFMRNCNKLKTAQQNNETADKAEGSHSVTTISPPKEGNTLEHGIYIKFAELFPQVISGEYSYLRLEADGFEPLSLEWIGDGRISVMHTYKGNGELMYDPMMTFDVNREAREMTAAEYEMSMPPLYQRVVDENGGGASVDGNGKEQHIRNLRVSLNGFASNWFDNIAQQDFIPVCANMVINGEVARITFDEDGKPVMPQPDRQPGNEDWSETPSAEDLAQPNAPSDDIEAYLPKAVTTLNLLQPDPLLSATDRNEYGYSYDGMLPLSAKRAAELFDADHAIYLLYPDNTEAMAFDREDIMSHDGLCGIEKPDWERSPVYAAQKAVAANNESARESELLYGTAHDGMFGIYQVKSGEAFRDLRFSTMDDVNTRGLSIVRDSYELVYVAPLAESDSMTNLNRIFEDFQGENPERSADYKGRSVSVSDVIVLQWRGEVSSHYVDDIGFPALPSFTGNEKQAIPAAEQQSYSQLGNNFEPQEPPAQEYAGPTVAELKADVDAGRSISLLDLAHAANAERGQGHTVKPKDKPSLLGRLDDSKQRAALQGQPDAHKSNGLEV